MWTKPIRGRLPNKFHPLTPTVAWIMNEGSGNKVYDIIGRNHGTFGAGATAPSWVAEGLDFDGTDDNINCGNKPNLQIINAITMVTSIKIDVFPTNTISTWEVILNKDIGFGTADVRQYAISLYCSSDVQKLQCVFASDDSTAAMLTLTSTTTGIDTIDVWYHIVATWDGTTNANGMKVYVNGILKGQGTSPIGVGTDKGNDFSIGRSSIPLGGDYFPFNGTIKEVGIYNRRLSASESWQLYINPYCWLAQPMDLASLYVSIGQEYTESVIIKLQSKYNHLSTEEYELLKILQTLDKKIV